jgi:hypothetical protein
LYYISNTGLLLARDKKENLEVTGTATTSSLKRRLKTFCPVSCIRPITAKLAPQWQISSRHFAPFLIRVKMFHSQYYLVATAMHMQSVRSQVCVCVCVCVCVYTHDCVQTLCIAFATHTHTHTPSQDREAGRVKKKHTGPTVTAACHRFGSPGRPWARLCLGVLVLQSQLRTHDFHLGAGRWMHSTSIL